MSIEANDLVYKYSFNDVWNLPDHEHLIRFSDKEIVMTRPNIILSWIYWELYRCFPGAELISETGLVGDFGASTHRKIGSRIFWHIFNDLNSKGIRADVWDLSKAFYEVTNEIYNVSCLKLSEYVTTVSLFDLIEIMEEFTIVEAKDNYRKLAEESDYAEHVCAEEIAKVHSVVSKVLYTDREYLKHNGIKKLTMAGLVNKGQVIQMVGPRGYVHDIDGSVFPYPIDVGYGEGLDNLYDSMIESRSASRASIMNTDPLQQSEWFNRKVQLAASVILRQVYIEGGCSNYITAKRLVSKDDLTLLKGKYYMDEQTDKPVLIWDSIDHLIGKVIEYRTITGCGCHDAQEVCQVCLGWISLIIPPKSNLGFSLSTPLCAMISQIIMSTKHYEGSSISKKLTLDSNSSRWFRISPKQPDRLFLTEFASKGNVLIRIDSDYVKYLSQILHIDATELSPSRITRIPELGISLTDKSGMMSGSFDILKKLEVSGMGISLSTQVLTYLKEHGWGSGKNYVEFTLKNWNVNTPVFIIPRKGDNIMSFFNDVKSYIEPQGKSNEKITDFKTVTGAIEGLITVLRRRLNKDNGQEFNITQAEIFVRSLMVVANNPERLNELPRPGDDFNFKVLPWVINNRTLTSMLAHQEQYKSLLSIHWRTGKLKTKHMLDDILKVK